MFHYISSETAFGMEAWATFSQLPHNTPQPADQSTFPREMSWFAWAKDDIQPGRVTFSHAVLQKAGISLPFPPAMSWWSLGSALLVPTDPAGGDP